MDVKNKIIFNTAVLYTRLIIGVVLGLLTTRLVLDALGETNYGIYMLVAGVAGMLSILNSNMANTSMRFMAHSLGANDKELSLKKGIYSKTKPNAQNKVDIKKAIMTLNNLGKYNFSQGVIVRNKKIISIEGKGGTEKMLEKSRSKKFRNFGVLVKFPKKNKI